ncbi:hypothetical protein HPB48_018212 [Haemaphysalis longicornis]|uniref:Uncharacterized protein n=1 Tax=Haemaphysalis longicornis TaxID=44386 RepID=A0A9J6H0K5_HAELO|nr:hypothetical protein HPB48_018212 [Haemaphysalis longicornis]
MMKHFWKWGMVCRFLGCLYIEGFWDRSLKAARVQVLSLYTVYSAACLTGVVAYEMGVVVVNIFLLPDVAGSFAKSLLLIVYAVVLIKIIVNVLCMTLGSSKLLQFLREAEAYEKATSFGYSAGSEACRRNWRTQARRWVSAAALVASYGMAMTIYMRNFMQGYDDPWHNFLKVLGFFSEFYLFFFDSVAYIVLGSTVDVLVEYLKSLVESLGTCEKNRLLLCSRLCPRTVEDIRHNFSRIQALIHCINDIWHPAITATSACLVWILCTTLYTVFDDGFTTLDIWLSVTYAVYASVGFFDLAVKSQELGDQAQKMKNATKSVRRCAVSEEYIQQVGD